MATTWIALVRAVNLGPVNRLPMADFRALLEALGHEDVRTVLQSGNALFSASKASKAATLERAIEKRLTADAGLDVKVLVRSAKEMAGVVDGNPFVGRRGVDVNELGVAFLSADPAAAKVEALSAAAYQPDEFEIGDRVVYTRQPSGVRASKLPSWEKALGVTVTARNWRTVTRLHELSR